MVALGCITPSFYQQINNNSSILQAGAIRYNFSMPETMVRCHQLYKSFGDHPVIQNVTFTVATGQILALLGPSGCGKTTTLRLIAGFEKLDSVWLEMAGRTVAAERTFVPPEKRRVGMVFHDYAIFPHLNVADNIAFGFTGRRPEKAERVAATLDLVGL